MVSITVITTVLTKSKITAAFARSNREEGITHAESTYEEVAVPSPSLSVINTQDNNAYGLTNTSTLK